LPNGQEIHSGLEMSRAQEQIALGFYYRWDWPDGKSDLEWLDKRKAWYSERDKEVSKRKRGRDTDATLRAALDEWRNVWARQDHAGWYPDRSLLDAYADWLTVCDRPEPPTVAEWIDTTWVFDWANSVGMPDMHHARLVWCSHTAVSDMARAQGQKVIPPGETPPDSTGYRNTWLSTHSHIKGLNLQSYDRQIVLTPQAASYFEQLLGRTHRLGQQADTVYAEVLTHTKYAKDKWERELKQAHWNQQADGQRQKLCLATHRRAEG